MVSKVGLEPTRACTHCALNAARLPFRHFDNGFITVDIYLTRNDNLCQYKRPRENFAVWELSVCAN